MTAHSANAGLDGFLDWWGQSLLSWVPTRLRALAAPRTPVILARLAEDDAVMLVEQRGRRRSDLGLLGALTPRRIRRLRRAQKKGAAALVLTVPADQALERRLTLPLAAAEDLDGVLRYEIERITPFRASELYYAHRLIARRAARTAKGGLDIALTMTPRAPLEPAMAALTAAGLRVDRIDVLGEGGAALGLDLLPKTPPKHGRGAVALVLLGLLLGSASLWIAAELRHLDQRTEMLRDAVFTARRQAIAAEERAAAATSAADPMLAAYRARTDRPRLVEALAALTEATPDDSWAESLSYKDGAFQLSGVSTSAGRLIEAFERHPALTAPAFTAPITRDGADGRERFSIAVAVAPPPKDGDAR